MILGKTRLWVIAASLAVLGGMGICAPSTADSADPNKIVVKDFMFMPTPLTVKAGTAVTWTNMDDEPHTVVSDTGLFRSAGMDTSESYSYKFDKPGTYHFACSIHPRMVGTIIVE